MTVNAWEGFKRFYRVFRWVVLVVMVIVIAMILKQAPPPRVKTDPLAAERTKFKMYQLQQAQEAGRAYKLELDEAEVNTFLTANLALAPSASGQAQGAPGTAAPPAGGGGEPSLEEIRSTVRDVKLNLVGDRVRAYVLFDFHGKDLSLVLEGRLRVVDGYLRLEPTAGELGSLPIPQATLDGAVSRLFDSPENKEKFRVPPEVENIRVEGGRLVVSYR